MIGGSICFGLWYLIYLTSGKKEDEKRREALAFQLLAGLDVDVPPPQPDRDIDKIGKIIAGIGIILFSGGVILWFLST